MREERTFARMHAIAASGLAPELAAPEIVGVLVEAIGIDLPPTAMIFRPGLAVRSSVWLEVDGLLDQVEQLASQGQPYHSQELPVLDEVLAGEAPLGSFATTFWGQGARSSGPWEDLWRGHQSRHGVQSIFRSPGGKYGTLLVGRSGRTDTFKARDLEAIDRTTHYLSRLADLTPEDLPGHELIEAASILFDSAGRPVLMSDGAEALLRKMGGRGERFPTLAGALAHLSAMFSGPKPGEGLETVANGHGTFRLGMKRMAGAGAQPMMLAAIERFVPAAFMIARGAMRVKASGRQMELALQLARGETLANAARAMNISHATCRYYLTELFNRTDTGSQAAMLAALTALGREGLAPV